MDEKWLSYAHLMFLPKSGIWPVWPNVRDINFKFVLPIIYINFNIQTKFEVNQTKIGHSIPKKLQKIT